MATVAKLSALSNVMSLPAPAPSVVVPLTAKAPLSVIAPFAVTLRLPETVDAPRSMALMSFNVTLLPDVIATVLKLSALSNITS